MTVAQALLAFTAAAGLLTVTPGLDTALVLRTAAVEGRRRAMLAGLGIGVGCLMWGLAASVGLGALLAVSRAAYDALRLVGAAYLIYLGVRMILYAKAFEVDTQAGQAPGEGARWFVRGLLTNLLNPKVGVFYVTFLPQFVPTGVNVTGFSMLLATIHVVEGLLWFLVLTQATRAMSGWLRRPRVTRNLDRGTGAVLVGFGLALLIDRRR